jgi:hypothetical protein
MSQLFWRGTDLIYLTAKKARIIANFISATGDLRTFWNGGTYFVGNGPSIPIGKEALVYWSTVDGATFLIHFAKATGETAARKDGSKGWLRTTK